MIILTRVYENTLFFLSLGLEYSILEKRLPFVWGSTKRHKMIVDIFII